MKVAVIGSSGGMGSFFVNYFLSEGHEVSGSDIRPGLTESRRFTFHESSSGAATGSSLVLVAVPIEKTSECARECLGVMKKGSTLMEISSVKRKVLPKLRKMVAAAGVRLVPVHPLFGPSMKPGERMRMLVVGSKNGEEMKLAAKMFPRATLVPVLEREHDRVVALTLSLTHLVNILYARTVSRHMRPPEFREVLTPTSAVQLALSEGVLSNDPTLYSYIQVENDSSSVVARTLARELAYLRRMLQSRDRKAFEELYKGLGGLYLGDRSREAALGRVYSMSASAGE